MRFFSLCDQLEFASISGDFNPIHLDPLAARRAVAGGLVVHGIHLLLWALDEWASTKSVKTSIISLSATFTRPVLVGNDISLSISPLTHESFNFSLTSGRTTVATLSVSFQQRFVEAELLYDLPEPTICTKLDAAMIEGCSGSLDLYFPQSRFNALFPNLINILPSAQLASLMATTRLVGVKCPGLNSLYYQLDLSLSQHCTASALNYRVTRFDERFNLVSMQVECPGLTGTVKAFLRPEPVQQALCSFIRQNVASSCFAGQKALVVGGSRGLGEVISKVLAMGGAEVILTYNSGQAEAQAVVSDITNSGGRAQARMLDIMTLDSKADIYGWKPTHLYYMATPHIFSGVRNCFSESIFQTFCKFYVEGFAKIFDYVSTPNLCGVFYPSSVALDEQPSDMLEYTCAKSAGEVLVAMLAKANPNVLFILRRLPRLATDQTNSLMPVRNNDPLSVVLSALNSFETSNQF
jgi:hypothetical protein